MHRKIGLAFLLVATMAFTANAGHRHHRLVARHTASGNLVTVVDPTDNADNSPYSDGWNDNLNPPADNGGSGYDAWVNVGNGGGGKFIANAGTGGRQIEGANSFGIFSGTGSFAEARPITLSITTGQYDVLGRFDLDNATAFSGFNIKSTTGTTFGAGELLSFGMTPATNNGIFVGGSINQTINLGHDIRGDIIQFGLAFDTTGVGTYTLTATDLTQSATGSVSGNLKSGGLPVAALGFANFNTGTNQSLIFDTPTINAVPEPSTLSLLAAPAILGAVMFLRRRRA